MASLLTAFLSSYIITLLIIRLQHLHDRYSGDHDVSGPQKFHTGSIPRIGGISIAIGLLTAVLVRLQSNNTSIVEISLLMCAIPTFSIGLIEDLTKKISVRARLHFTAVAAALAAYYLGAQITRLDIPGIDFVLSFPIVAMLFAVFAITGLSNAYNIIDGFNGLSSMVGIMTLLGLAYVGYVIDDTLIEFLSLIMVAAIMGFFPWNYPRGHIFLGDGGAYLIGFWIGVLTVLLVARHSVVSPWFALLINAYPILETLFTIYRRKIHQGKSLSQPDGIHFHTLIYRRVLLKNNCGQKGLSANAQTAPHLWILTGLSISPAIIWWDSTVILIFFLIVFFLSYIWIYSRIIKFKTPKWLILNF